MSTRLALAAAPLAQSGGPSEWAMGHGYLPLWIALTVLSAVVLVVVLARQLRKPKVSPAIRHLRRKRAQRRAARLEPTDKPRTMRVFVTRVSDPEEEHAALHEVDLPRVEHEGRWHTLH